MQLILSYSFDGKTAFYVQPAMCAATEPPQTPKTTFYVQQALFVAKALLLTRVSSGVVTTWKEYQFNNFKEISV